MKSLADVQSDMSELYEAVKTGSVELKTAAELANIAGKYLKAEQLKLAKEIFVHHRERGVQPPQLPQPDAGEILRQ